MKKQTTGGLLLFLALAVPAFCQDANEILKKVGETYANLKSAHFEGATVSETSTGAWIQKSKPELSSPSPNQTR